MANQLKMDLVHTILSLHRLGWSDRRIARELGVHRETVARHIRLSRADSKPATNAPLGSGPAKPASNAPPGSSCMAQCPLGRFACMDRPESTGPQAVELPPGCPNSAACPRTRACLDDGPKPATDAPLGSPGADSTCEPYREVILAKRHQGLTARRIYQDLVTDSGFDGSYYSVRRFVRKMGKEVQLPFRRMECSPGQEAQVDLGSGPPIVPSAGRRRRSHVFRIVLSHSRKGYSETIFRQTTDSFLQCLENAFWHFGGVPKTLVIDNLKAAVKKADWFDPELNPKVRSFCEHYGTVILPAKPYAARHKGKIERGIGYVKSNALKGRRFAALSAANTHLLEWETAVADTRIHGTTRKQVGKVFEQVERPALLPLPAGRFGFFHEAQRCVHRDGHVEVAKAYYSVPPEYLGRIVWARWDGRLVRIFNRRMEPIAVHAQQDAGRFSTQRGHIHDRKISGVERGATWLLRQVGFIGEDAQRWAEAMLDARGVAGVRVLVGLRALAGRHEGRHINEACRIALTHSAFRLRTLRSLLKRVGDEQEAFEFLEQHEIIRDPADYGELVGAALAASESY